jgi:hypothetical protein
MRTWMIVLALAVGTPAGLSCDSTEAAFDCQQICSRYESCFDSDYDVSACRDRCRDKAGDDDRFKDKADACADCIDDRSCSSATFNCLTECAGIVP